MSATTINTDETLEEVTRHLAGHVRVIWTFRRHPWHGKIWGVTDSKWAVCPVTRKSTSATYLAFGAHRCSLRVQHRPFMRLSSGKVEFQAAVRCACRALGFKIILVDFGLQALVGLVTDSGYWKERQFLKSRKGMK